MIQRGYIFFMIFVSFSIFPGISLAEIYRLTFTVNTTNYTDINNRQVNADIIVGDTKYRPPNAIKSLSVTAPNGKVFPYMPTNLVASKHLFWDETGDEFWFSAWAADFGGTIPSGKYTVKVTDLSGFSLTHYEDITINFLPCPTITDPLSGDTVASLTPRITWSAVPGARLYRVYLRNKDWNSPIYPVGTHELRVYRNWVTIPKGVLLPQTNYELRIQARDSDQNYNQRANSDWVSFRTP